MYVVSVVSARVNPLRKFNEKTGPFWALPFSCNSKIRGYALFRELSIDFAAQH